MVFNSSLKSINQQAFSIATVKRKTVPRKKKLQ